jgi:hypothetical protein
MDAILKKHGISGSTIIRALLFTAAICAGSLAAPLQPEPARPPVDDKLGEKLLKKSEGAENEDIMQQILKLMQNVAREIQLDFDTGNETQAMQRRIVAQLDEAIQIAAAQRRAGRTSSVAGTDKRRMSKPKPQKRPEKTGDQAQTGESSESGTVAPPGTAAEGVAAGGELKEVRRTWGHLPMRAREEITQGVGERFLERYREWVERYYRALQENDEP